ncbi:MAG TPA: RNase III inhibitor [Clostridiaceae bacterium]|nr:RNase III inhibitor [Clostridiaceae bacterium]
MPFSIVRQDITKMHVDAIVNAANTALQMGGGVCGAIFRAAGANDLKAACDKLAPIKTGEAVITPGFRLPAKYIIHTAGPIYRGGRYGEEEQLRSCYLNSLKCAIENKCESIAFPLISSGIYGYPKDEALQVASRAIHDFLDKHDIDVYLVVFDKDSFVISEKLMGEVASYIDEHYVSEHRDSRRSRALFEIDIDTEDQRVYDEPMILYDASAMYDEALRVPTGLDELIGNLDEPFSQTLLRLIDAKGKTDVEVYKRANIDRKLFSKIRTGKGYMPSKRTILALAVALELTLDETEDLLRRAGYALSHSNKFDVIVECFIANGKYDIFEINQVLFKYDQPLLGG